MEAAAGSTARRVASALAIIAVGLAFPALAPAATRYVDDDGADCPQAAHTTVQSAVDAAAAGDTIRVCRGTYREQIVIPEAKDKLKLRSLPQTADAGATLMPPTSGFTVGGVPVAILSVLGAENVVIRGFRFEGPLELADPVNECGGHHHASAVAVPSGSATVDRNHMTNIALVDCAPDPSPVTGARVVVDRNVIDGGTVDGVNAEQALAVVQRNTIVGRGDDSGWGVLLAGEFNGIRGSVRSNDISSMREGVLVIDGLDVLVHGNRIHDNGTGIELGDQSGSSGEVRRNLIERNGTGLLGRSFAGEWLIRDNRVLDSSDDGIFIESNAFGSHSIRGNRSLGSGNLDCHDETTGGGTAGTANFWSSNIGLTDDPNVCRAP
jgi:hypothetical protein